MNLQFQGSFIMFFKGFLELSNILKGAGTAIICLSDGDELSGLTFSFEDFSKKFKAIIVEPGVMKNTSGKPINQITVDQIREVIEMTTVKASSDRYFFFKNAEKMQIQAQNATLKLFEEPKDNYHFILFTNKPEALLPTIRSRAYTYKPLRLNTLIEAPKAEKTVFETAKRLLVADTSGVIAIADELHKRKDTEKSPRREYVLNVLETTIELAEKSYFKTGNKAFARKINGLILAHKNISANGIIRLQIISNLI